MCALTAKEGGRWVRVGGWRGGAAERRGYVAGRCRGFLLALRGFLEQEFDKEVRE